jgi:hypothetical protein
MNTDDRIREELAARTAEIDRIDLDERSLFGMLARVFAGGLRRWAAFGMVLTLIATALTFWTGYEFFVAVDLESRVFWGVLMLAAFHAMGSFKMWFFMEMNRNSVLREVKRVELELARMRED